MSLAETKNLSSDYRDGVADERKVPFKTARQMAQDTPRLPDWKIPGYVAGNTITEIDGRIKVAGKTTLVSHMVYAILHGESFLGHQTSKTGVVWLTEQPPASFRRVLEDAQLADRDDLHVLSWHDVVAMSWQEVARAAVMKARDAGAGVLVVDTLGQFAGIRGDGENNAGEAQWAMRPLQEAAAAGLAVVFTRHERKGGGEVGESGRGSTAFGGAADIILSVRRGEGNTRSTVRVIESLSRFRETPDRLVVELTEGGYRSLGDATAFSEQEATREIIRLLPNAEEEALPTPEIVEALQESNIGRTVVTGALSKLEAEGRVVRVGKGHKGSPYCYYRP